jgi:hypothetical protein
MNIRPIRSDADYRVDVREIDACWGAPPGTAMGAA